MKWTDKIDVLILCGGSATDLPKQTPEYAKLFNVIDSFDTHAHIPEHFAAVDAAYGTGACRIGRRRRGLRRPRTRPRAPEWSRNRSRAGDISGPRGSSRRG